MKFRVFLSVAYVFKKLPLFDDLVELGDFEGSLRGWLKSGDFEQILGAGQLPKTQN